MVNNWKDFSVNGKFTIESDFKEQYYPNIVKRESAVRGYIFMSLNSSF